VTLARRYHVSATPTAAAATIPMQSMIPNGAWSAVPPSAPPIDPRRSALMTDFPFVSRDRSEDRDGTAGLKRFGSDRRFLNDLFIYVGGVVCADVLMEDRDDPSAFADLGNDGRVVRIFVMPRNPAPFRDPTFALKHGVAELEDIARQCLLERRNRPPPNVISARVERVTLRAGESQGLDRQAQALAVVDLLADSFASKLQHFLIERWNGQHRRRRREANDDGRCDPSQHNELPRPRSTIHEYLVSRTEDSVGDPLP
jgi:hypothetical protein